MADRKLDIDHAIKAGALTPEELQQRTFLVTLIDQNDEETVKLCVEERRHGGRSDNRIRRQERADKKATLTKYWKQWTTELQFLDSKILARIRMDPSAMAAVMAFTDNSSGSTSGSVPPTTARIYDDDMAKRYNYDFFNYPGTMLPCRQILNADLDRLMDSGSFTSTETRRRKLLQQLIQEAEAELEKMTQEEKRFREGRPDKNSKWARNREIAGISERLAGWEKELKELDDKIRKRIEDAAAAAALSPATSPVPSLRPNPMPSPTLSTRGGSSSGSTSSFPMSHHANSDGRHHDVNYHHRWFTPESSSPSSIATSSRASIFPMSYHANSDGRQRDVNYHHRWFTPESSSPSSIATSSRASINTSGTSYRDPMSYHGTSAERQRDVNYYQRWFTPESSSPSSIATSSRTSINTPNAAFPQRHSRREHRRHHPYHDRPHSSRTTNPNQAFEQSKVSSQRYAREFDAPLLPDRRTSSRWDFAAQVETEMEPARLRRSSSPLEEGEICESHNTGDNTNAFQNDLFPSHPLTSPSSPQQTPTHFLLARQSLEGVFKVQVDGKRWPYDIEQRRRPRK
ncbi:hypothetical protein BC829DRAFT_482324 [Chytridium lagenaria]|nr:hypothetical protein BC829DRAFT_482324 [Chytridium lagenaria]